MTPFPKENYTAVLGGQWRKNFRTDIDIIAVKNGKKYNCQVKSSAGALNGGPDEESAQQAARSLSNWIGAAKAKDGIESVKIVVPQGVLPSQHIQDVLDSYEIVWKKVVIESTVP